MPKLVLIQGNSDKSEIQLTGKITIGRGVNNHLKVYDYNVSRQHVSIEKIGNNFVIKDLSSTNGTLINGLFITEKVLDEGDHIQIGKNIFLFEKDSSKIYFPPKTPDIPKEYKDKREKKLDITLEMETRELNHMLKDWFQKKPHELIKAHKKLTILFEIGKSLGTYTELSALFSNILESLLKVLPIHRSMVLLSDHYSNNFVPIIVKSKEIDFEDINPSFIYNEIIQHVITHKKSVLTTDNLTEYFANPSLNDLSYQVVSVLCVPIFIRKEIIGIIWAATRDQKTAFSSDDLELVSAVAQQSSLAIENIRLTQERIKGERFIAIDEIVSSIAHEIKNPLSAIQIYTELLQKNHDDTKQQKYCSVILDEIELLTEITNRTLDYGENISLKIENTDTHEIVSNVLTVLELQARKNNVTINTKFNTTNNVIPVDRNRIIQVLLNISLNALQVSPPDSSLTISTDLSINKNYYRFSITDSGPGIPPDLMDKIFQPFFSTRKDGTGLGLSISQRIVEEHDGRILVESHKNGGAVFHIELPIERIVTPLPRW